MQCLMWLSENWSSLTVSLAAVHYTFGIMRMIKSNALILIYVWTRKINHQKMANKVDFCLVVTSNREKWYGR